MPEATRVLVVDDEESLRHMLSLALSKDGFSVWTAKDAQEGLQALRDKGPFQLCVSDVRMPGMDGLAFIEEGRRLGEAAPVFIAMSAYGDQALAIEALRRGAFDYISKPFPPEELCLKLRLVVERRRLAPRAAAGEPHPARRRPRGVDTIISRAPAMRVLLDTVQKLARFPSTALVTGETGTGKERIAEAIHAESPRAARAFVAINCGAIPENLLESELFGHVKGAFTDASQDKAGLFEAADGGTLFLDEIGELPLGLQVKLLRALVEGEIRRVGDNRPRPVDVRVVAATARDLEAAVASEGFRRDLYYRLNVVALKLPPLRERVEDIPALAAHFIERLSNRLGVPARPLTDDALSALSSYAWPGNVRELENALERALVLSEDPRRLSAADLDGRFFEPAPEPSIGGLEAAIGEELKLKQVLPRVEQILIRRALERTEGNRTRAAELLGISQRALLYKLKDYGIR